MSRKRYADEDCLKLLKEIEPQQVEVLVGRGMARVDAIPEVCITEQTNCS